MEESTTFQNNFDGNQTWKFDRTMYSTVSNRGNFVCFKNTKNNNNNKITHRKTNKK